MGSELNTKETIVKIKVLGAGGGGSNGNDLKWGRDPREDEMEWARRCALAAIQSLGKRPRYGRRR